MDSLRSWLLIGLIFLLVAGCLTDCVTGRNRYCPGVVRQHVYTPPHTTLTSSTDEKGHMHIHSVYHSADYHLLIECRQPTHVVNLSVSMYNYAHYTDGNSVTVGERLGRWSGIIWQQRIILETSPQY